MIGPMMRSFLFVPGDSERKLARAAERGADALILDLEDAVDETRKDAARRLVADYLRSRRDSGPQLWVRINPLGTTHAREDVAAVAPQCPAGIVLPKARSRADVVELAAWLDGQDRAGGIGILPIVTETPAAALDVAGYAAGAPRLCALTWGAEDLGAALQVRATRDAGGGWLPLFQMLRDVTRLAAAAAGVPAIETICTALDDAAVLATQIASARQIGFAGMLALHPGQVAAINAGFTPTAADIAQARRVVAAFAAAGNTGVVRLDGRMLDRPHLAQAHALLRAAD